MHAHLRSFEWRMLRADRMLLALTLFFGVVVGYGLYNGAAWVRFQNRTIANAQKEERDRLESHKALIARLTAGDTAGLKPWLDPRVPSNAGGTLAARYTVLPPASLAALAVGQSDLYPYYAKISTRTKQTFIVNDEIENPTNLLSGRFDLSFAVVYLYPLLILALTYNVVSAEREQGTLALLLSQPVPAARLIAVKLTVRAIAVLALAVGLTVAGAGMAGVDLTAPDAVPRLAMWIAIVVLYGALWFAAALAVNLLGRSSATNAVILLGVWLAVVVLIPSLHNVAVTTVAPSPSRVEMTTALRRATNEANEQGNALLQRYYLDHPELMGGAEADMNNFAARSIAVQEAVEASMGPTLAQFDRHLAAQQALADRYRFVSPALVAHAALLDVAGTSVHRYAHFQRLVDEYHSAWRTFFFPRIVSRSQLTAADYDALPRFRFREEPIGAVMTRVASGLVGLLLPTVLIAFTAMRGRRRVAIAEA